MKKARIKVASPSFSNNAFLKTELSKSFPNSFFNDSGAKLSGADLIRFLGDAKGAVIGLEEITREILDGCPDLKMISKYGVGLDNIDQAACKARGIQVRVSFGVNKTSVAELTLAFMISLIRNIAKTSFELKKGTWKKDGGKDLSGKTVGIIGVGHIGKEVVRLLKPFGCAILANDIIQQKAYYKKNRILEASKEKIYKTCDIVTVHTPLTSQTRHMIDARALKMMKPSAFLINAARGTIVHEADLKTALKNGTIAGAALDVYETEPAVDRELLELPNLLCTPHIGGNSLEAVQAMGLRAIQHLKEFF